MADSSFSASGGSSTARKRQSLASMLSSTSLPTWRHRLDRSEGSTAAASATPAPASGTANRHAHAAAPTRPAASTRVTSPHAARAGVGPALTLDQILTPAKVLPGGRPTSHAAQAVVAAAMDRGVKAATTAGPFQYDLYPSSSATGQRSLSPAARRSSPFAATRNANSFYSSLDATTLASSNDDVHRTTLRRYASPSRSDRSPSGRARSPPSKYSTEVDIAATQQRIRAMMQDQQREPAPPSAQGHYSLRQVEEPKTYPLTAAVKASKGARTLAQMKMDVAMRLHDRSHPAHPQNHPTKVVETAGSFHLGHHAPATADEKRSTPEPISFFPNKAAVGPDVPAAAVPAQPKLPQSAFLATMHAGALRVEHLLAQPRMQLMLNAVLPSSMSREQILSKPDSPPRTDSTVDRLIYDTIRGRAGQGQPGAHRSHSQERPIQAMSGYAPPRTSEARPATSPAPFSRATLLSREARLEALLALNSSHGETVPRMSFDPEEARRQEEAKETFFDARSVLGATEQVQATTLLRQRLVEHQREKDRESGHSPQHVTTNVEVVLEQLLGSPTRRNRELQVTNMPPVAHEGGVADVLRGVTSPLRYAMAHAPAENTIEMSFAPTASPVSFSSFQPLSPASPSPLPSSNDSAVLSAAALDSLMIGQRELDYLTATTSLSPLFHRAGVHDAYANALNSKAASFRFVSKQHLLQDAYESWRARFLAEKERTRVLQARRHEGHHGYEAWRTQQTESIAALRKEQHAHDQAQVPQAPSQSPPAAKSALLSDVPIRPACVALAAAHRKVFATEQGVNSKNELLATIHNEGWVRRRAFAAWCKWSRTERIGKRMAAKSHAANLHGWFRNWRDLMHIVRGEFHQWVHSKQTDAIAEAEAAARDAEERVEREEQQHRSYRDQREGGEARDVPQNQSLYARSSGHVKGAMPCSPSPRQQARSSPVAARSSPSHGGQMSSPSSARGGGVGSVAPLTAMLSSAFTQEQFWGHQEAIWKSRRAEEAARTHFADLKRKLNDERDGSADDARSRTTGPLLFQRGASLQHPTFGIDAQVQPIASHSGRQNYLPPRDDSDVAVELGPFRLSSPVHTAEGVLHGRTGHQEFDRHILENPPQPSFSPVGTPMRSRDRSPSPGPRPAPRISPVPLPSFLQPQRAESPPPQPTADPLSPVRHHVVPTTGNFASSSPQREASATSHGFLPLPFATAAHEVYFRSSHWVPPPAATVSDEELRANIRISAEMRRSNSEMAEQNKLAQWKRVEMEKQFYRQKVQEYHEPKH